MPGITAEQLLAATALPAWICIPATGEILSANAAAATLLESTPAALRGRRLAEPFPAPAPAQALKAWVDAGPEPEPVWQLRRPAGGTIAARVAVAQLETAAGPRLVVTALPAPAPAASSSPHRSEEELLRAAKRESLELLAGGVAHDFNNLLTALLGNINLARMDSSVSSEVQEWLEEAEKATGRARDLTHQLLTFSKGGEPVRRLVDLVPCLRDAAKFARQGSRVRCDFDLAADLWPAEVDTGQIGQVVHNLVLNAVQAMPRGGVVTVAARNIHRDTAHQLGLGPHHFVVIEVRDQGPGIKPEDMARIFQPYFTTKRHGSGLGLATSQTIARRHYGALRVESVPGRGAVFLLYLPSNPGARVEKPGREAPLPRFSGRILFMDDEPAIRQMAPDILGRLGFDTEIASDGAEALATYTRALATGRRFDAVILDLTVPAGMGGLETVKQLRALDPRVRALVSSGYADNEALLNYSEFGFSGTVTKPYCLSELASVLGRVLASGVAPAR
ncbi:MAG TPA: ATP-binding protein [Opitutaceae bacterium]|nr:ATP-binding protein [Opitutaceae bacterium]